ncbi:MAG: three-Cys-motif partner protein TcmP [Isosphaeraceae bacterium]
MSSHESHRWRSGEPPPPIRSHSLVKHRVLEEYLKRYVAAVTRNPRVDKLTLTIVDGFAGGNTYSDEKTGELRPGSPSIILNALNTAKVAAQERRKKQFVLDDHYFFIEKDVEAFGFLRDTLSSSEHGSRIGNAVHLVHGDFCDHVAKVIESVRSRAGGEHAIFILDQCGYTDVPFVSIKEILGSLRKSEVILTFATGFLIDFLSDKYKGGAGIRKAGIDVERLVSKIDKSDRHWKRLIQVELRDDLQIKAGAGFSTPFFIRSRDSNRDLWLVHLSGHYRARDVMMGIHWEHTNSFAHYGRPGLNMLGFDPDEGVSGPSQALLPGFYFDETAKDLTLEATLRELPRFLTNKRDLIDVRSLFAEISNDTPATVALLREVLKELAADGVFEIRDKTGLTVRQKGVQFDTDVIHMARQMRLFGFGH